MDRGDAPGVTARTPIALSVAGSDSGAGAGIQADLRTFAALGVYGATAIAALTAQNTLGVRAIHLAPPEVVAAQIDAVMEDFAVAAVKIGMLGSAAIVETVAERLPSPLAGEGSGVRGPRREARSLCAEPLIRPRSARPPSPARGEGNGAFVVYDPVMAASSGDPLSGAGLLEAVRAKLLPRVDCLTPNLAEAAALLGEGIARSEADMARQGAALIALGPRAVLMKGGHLEGDEAVDLLVTTDGVRRFAAPRLASTNLHGTGCTLSSAIAAHVVLGKPLPEAVAAGKAFVRTAIEAGRGLSLGAGPGPLIQMNLRR
ncbi:MAG TPA: hydroxymethylpyrimidine/phosphomethylpyrimidine kinase [Roseiarcus sp.]|nr:hydroxymethylpyrimidine/phosphomethylpyrimidine kinase [Roseiarcus sp.]